MAIAFTASTYVQVALYLYHTAQIMGCSIPQLIPWKSWLVMLIIFGTVAIGMHEVLMLHCSLRQTLFLGFAGTIAVIMIAVVPVIFPKKAHG